MGRWPGQRQSAIITGPKPPKNSLIGAFRNIARPITFQSIGHGKIDNRNVTYFEREKENPYHLKRFMHRFNLFIVDTQYLCVRSAILLRVLPSY